MRSPWSFPQHQGNVLGMAEPVSPGRDEGADPCPCRDEGADSCPCRDLPAWQPSMAGSGSSQSSGCSQDWHKAGIAGIQSLWSQPELSTSLELPLAKLQELLCSSPFPISCPEAAEWMEERLESHGNSLEQLEHCARTNFGSILVDLVCNLIFY